MSLWATGPQPIAGVVGSQLYPGGVQGSSQMQTVLQSASGECMSSRASEGSRGQFGVIGTRVILLHSTLFCHIGSLICLKWWQFLDYHATIPVGKQQIAKNNKLKKYATTEKILFRVSSLGPTIILRCACTLLNVLGNYIFIKKTKKRAGIPNK